LQTSSHEQARDLVSRCQEGSNGRAVAVLGKLLGEHDMVTKNITSDLIKGKQSALAYIEASHKAKTGEAANEFFLLSVASGACYNSKGAIDYKRKMIQDEIFAQEQKELNGGYTSHVKLDGLDVELDILKEIHAVDLSVHESINGTQWEPRDKKSRPSQLSEEKKAYYAKKYG
jgi:hypothetical protein